MRWCMGDLVDGVAVALAGHLSDEDSSPNTREEEVVAALDEVAAGGMIVVSDDAHRENEGDLIMAAQHASEQSIAFFVRYTSGIVTVALSSARAALLRCPPMVPVNEAPLETAFTVSLDAREGLTTGISAQERARTIRALADPSARAEDFVRPGHVFPLIAKEGGRVSARGTHGGGLRLDATGRNRACRRACRDRLRRRIGCQGEGVGRIRAHASPEKAFDRSAHSLATAPSTINANRGQH